MSKLLDENSVKPFLRKYLKERPLFLALIRAKEASLYHQFLPLKKPVLDLGCGDGFFAKVAFGKVDIGIDVKDSRIKEASSQKVYKKIIIFDGQKLPFADSTFSTIVSNCVLEHIEDLDQAINEVFRVLKPGGMFLTTVVAKPWEEYFLGNLLLGNLYKKWMRKKQVHYHMYTNKQWVKYFKQHGFKIEKEIGYLDQKAVRLIDMFHYLSLPSLLTYKLFGRWVIWKNKLLLFPLQSLINTVSDEVDSFASGNIFYALKK